MAARRATQATREGAAATGIETDLTPLEGQLGFLLRLAQMAVFKDLLAALKPLDLRLADLSALLMIERNPGLKQQALGEALHIQRSNLVAIVDQLEKRGLIERAPMRGDRRSYALSLTDPGAELLVRAKARHAAHEARVAEAAGPVHEELTQALRRIAAML